MFRLPIKGVGERGRLFSCENLHRELSVFPSFLNLPSKVINSTDCHDNSAFKGLRLVRGDKMLKFTSTCLTDGFFNLLIDTNGRQSLDNPKLVTPGDRTNE